MIAAIAMSQNKLIQMNTGEGKTMAAVLPAILKALDGKGVHVFTANDYLAKRDAMWMKPVYDFFNIKVGYINEGISKIEKYFKISNIFSIENQKIFTSVNLALHARVLLEKDKDYIIRDGKIEIIDQFTGRIAEKRRWPHGIHKAVELKEKLFINKEGIIFNSITFQHFVKLYPNLSGMTATAVQAASEFFSFYNFKITIIPPNKKNKRIDKTDRIYATKEAKNKALLEFKIFSGRF